MTYEEIKTRLTQCETKLQGLKQTKPTSGNVANYNLAVQKLEVLKESLSKKLSEAEKTAFVNGQATEYEDEKELNKLKDNPDVKSIKTASGKKIKEQQGVTFSVEETSAIAKKTGKAVAMGLKALGDEVAHMKAKKIEENSFEIYVEYKNGSDDQFSFYISDDTLHLVDFSFDKELVDVGVKPSGEAIVNVDVLSNELQKHWKSMKEGMSDQEFADAQENDRLNKHPEKDTILKIKALLAKEKQNQLKEAPKGMFYIEVSIRDARKALAIIDDQPALKNAVEMNGSNVYYLTDEGLAYDLMMDFGAQGIEVVDTNIEDEDDMLQEKEVEAPEGGIEQGGDLDVGHQDDEPNMLLKDVYDIAQYAAKLHKALIKYDQFDGEVDFPQWWQKKVILARDYISAAQHYLEAEEKQPALDQLALEENRVKVLKEDWGSSDHAHMMQQIHKAIGEPKTMPSPFNNSLEAAVADYVDFYWDDWEEYKQDPQELYDKAKRDYLRYFFKDTFNKMVQMFEPMDESIEEKSGNPKASYNKLKKEYDALVGKMKQLAVHFKTAEGESKAKIVAALKQHTARKRELESLIDKTVGGVGMGQELDTNLSEAKATCCGKCGRVHVKGSECKRPFLKGKDHCRYN